MPCGGDYGTLGNYVQVTDTGNTATLSFDPQGLASGSGGTLINDHVLAIT